RVAFEAGVEETRRVRQRGALGEGHLHDVLVGLACADDSVVLPDRNPSPLPFLDDVGIGFLDQGAEPAEHRAPPVAELLDSCVYQFGRRLAFLRLALLHARCASVVPRPPYANMATGATILPGSYSCNPILTPFFLLPSMLQRPAWPAPSNRCSTAACR